MDVAVVEAETNESKPNKAVIVSKLNSLTDILKASGKLTEAGQKLLPLAQKALAKAAMSSPAAFYPMKSLSGVCLPGNFPPWS